MSVGSCVAVASYKQVLFTRVTRQGAWRQALINAAWRVESVCPLSSYINGIENAISGAAPAITCSGAVQQLGE